MIWLTRKPCASTTEGLALFGWLWEYVLRTTNQCLGLVLIHQSEVVAIFQPYSILPYCSFQWKLRSHWPQFLRQRHVAVVIPRQRHVAVGLWFKPHCHHSPIIPLKLMWQKNMMTSSNGNIFRVTGPLSGEFTGHRWIPHTKASDAELWWSLDLRLNQQLDKQWIHRWLETSSRSLWRHCNEQWLCNGLRYIHILITTAFFAYELGWYYYKICWDVCST